MITVKPKIIAELDPNFVPASLWNQTYQDKVTNNPASEKLTITISRIDNTTFRKELTILPHTAENQTDNLTYVERIIKFMIWAQGGCRIAIAGNQELVAEIKAIYSGTGQRKFDWEVIGKKMFQEEISVSHVEAADLPENNEPTSALGRHLKGNRIGFDLGGSDRKCAAVIDGEVVFSTEIPWDPYFKEDPQYQYQGIVDSLQKAAEHLPSVDAIGGSSAGIYINNEVRVASLFRGIKDEKVFDEFVRPIFKNICAEHYPNVPFQVINDGEVTALAGSMSMQTNSVLGVAMGTSEAVGYVDPKGNVTTQINELAFAPIDYRQNGPIDEWSGDEGCGVQFFSQQGVARLAKVAGYDFGDMPFAEQLIKVQEAMEAGEEQAAKIYQAIGVAFGYAIAHYAEFYHIETLIIMGRVTSGPGGQIIIDQANQVLLAEFPTLSKQINIVQPDEKMKRHGQAVAAASLAQI